MDEAIINELLTTRLMPVLVSIWLSTKLTDEQAIKNLPSRLSNKGQTTYH